MRFQSYVGLIDLSQVAGVDCPIHPLRLFSVHFYPKFAVLNEFVCKHMFVQRQNCEYLATSSHFLFSLLFFPMFVVRF